MAKMNWYLPAALAATVAGGLWWLRKQNLSVKPGDYVAVDPRYFATPVALPVQLPPDARLLVRADTLTKDALNGYVVGYVASPSGEAVPIAGGAAGIPVPTPIQKSWVTAIYRGSPPQKIG